MTPATAGEKVLHAFTGGSDGAFPKGPVSADAAGNLYGTTYEGGNTNGGTVFKITPGGAESIFYLFQGGNDGAAPFGGLLLVKSGDIYGTTLDGGNANEGTVFKITADGTESILYAFQGGSDGQLPEGNLIQDASGDLFGVTGGGGNFSGPCVQFGCGTVFELQPNGTKITLYSFAGGNDGNGPNPGLVRDAAGNLYGTTVEGGSNACQGAGCGTVFKIAPDGTESILLAFLGDANGGLPQAGLIADSAGNMYGTTAFGGNSSNICGCGVVFKVTPTGSETVLYAFKAGEDGANPDAGLVMDKAGNLYGTTEFGGSGKCAGDGCGTVFKLTPAGKETVLNRFFKDHGQLPEAPLLLVGNRLYRTTTVGGKDKDGVVFRVTP